MNKQRRTELEKVNKLLEQANDILEDVKYDEDYALNNLPESFQMSERGEKMQEYVDALDEAVDSIKEIKSNLNDIICGF